MYVVAVQFMPTNLINLLQHNTNFSHPETSVGRTEFEKINMEFGGATHRRQIRRKEKRPRRRCNEEKEKEEGRDFEYLSSAHINT